MNKKSHNKFYVFFYSYIFERKHLKLAFLVCIYVCVCVCVCVCMYVDIYVDINFMAPFYGCGSTASRLQSHYVEIFTTNFREIPATH